MSALNKMDFNKASKGHEQELAGIIYQLKLLCRPFRVHDVDHKSFNGLEDKKMLKSNISNKGVSFNQAKEITEAISAFQETLSGKIDLRGLSDKKILRLLNSLKPISNITSANYLKTKKILQATFLLNSATSDRKVENSKLSRSDRVLTNSATFRLKQNIENLEDFFALSELELKIVDKKEPKELSFHQRANLAVDYKINDIKSPENIEVIFDDALVV